MEGFRAYLFIWDILIHLIQIALVTIYAQMKTKNESFSEFVGWLQFFIAYQGLWLTLNYYHEEHAMYWGMNMLYLQ